MVRRSAGSGPLPALAPPPRVRGRGGRDPGARPRRLCVAARPLGELAHSTIVRRDLTRIFDYRRLRWRTSWDDGRLDRAGHPATTTTVRYATERDRGRYDIPVSVSTDSHRSGGLRAVPPSDSAVNRVTAEIRRAVLSGALAPGQSFSIAELSSQLGVSHIPVREALQHLSAQGLIVMRPGRSAMVSPLSREELRLDLPTPSADRAGPCGAFVCATHSART